MRLENFVTRRPIGSLPRELQAGFFPAIRLARTRIWSRCARVNCSRALLVAGGRPPPIFILGQFAHFGALLSGHVFAIAVAQLGLGRGKQRRRRAGKCGGGCSQKNRDLNGLTKPVCLCCHESLWNGGCSTTDSSKEVICWYRGHGRTITPPMPLIYMGVIGVADLCANPGGHRWLRISIVEPKSRRGTR